MDDDLYPNDSSSFWLPSEPKEQRIERKKENAQIIESINVMKDLVARLEKRIAFYESVHSIPAEVKADPQAFLIMHNANEQTALSLIQEKEYIESLIPSNKR